jgi:cytochrome c553
MTLKHTVITSITAVLLSGILPGAALHAADAQPKYTIKDVMKALHKGDENIGKKVARGQGTAEDFSKLLDYYSALPANKPPRGEQASWDSKTAAMVKAARALKAGDAGAVESYKAATNCKACHTAHKPEKKP